jgi:hypothetical protein
MRQTAPNQLKSQIYLIIIRFSLNLCKLSATKTFRLNSKEIKTYGFIDKVIDLLKVF